MAQRGDYLRVRTGTVDGSDSTTQVLAETTDVSISFSAEALETTSQDDGLNATFIGGKVSCTISGSFLLATSATNFSTLFTYMNAGTKIELDAVHSYGASGAGGTVFLDGQGVITGLELSGGKSDVNTTGSYTIQASGNMAAS